MLKLVESLAVKAKRAKSTTVVFVPLGESVSHRCSCTISAVRTTLTSGLPISRIVNLPTLPDQLNFLLGSRDFSPM
jgi:hypothetical protein